MGRSFQRARRPEQKALQRDRILAAARTFLERAQHSSELSLADVAQLSGMARSNVYRYFDSREAILLAILASQIAGWIDEVVGQLEGVDAACEVETRLDHLAETIDAATATRPLLCHLVSVLPGLLDDTQAADPDDPVWEEVRERRSRLTETMHRAMPELTDEQHFDLLRHVVSFVIGAWPLSSSTEGTTLCDRRKPSFQRELRRAVRLVARGILDDEKR